MGFDLRKSTAGQVVQFKMVDSTTGLKKTGLTIANTDIKLVFEAGTTQTSKNSGGATEIGSTGVYYMTLDATDTATLGKLRADIEVSGALPWFSDFMILTAAAWDALHAASGGSIPADVTKLLGTAWLAPGTAGTPDVNAKLLGGTAQTGRDVGANVLLSTGTGTGQLDFTSGVVKANVVQSLGVAVTNEDFTVASATSSTITLPTTYSSGASLPDDQRYQWCALSVVSGTGTGQVVLLTTAGGSARQYNVNTSTMVVQLDNTSKCTMVDTVRTNANYVNGVSTGSVTTINANLGTTQAIAFNANNFQKVSLNDILATTLTETSGQLAGGFKQFFNISSPTSTMNLVTAVTTVTTTTTATNLTNAPTAGDFTATMKTSIGTAVAASAVASVTGNVGGNVVGSVASVTAAVTLSAGNSPVLQSGTATAGGATSITIQTALGANSLPVGCKVKVTSGTGAGQCRTITAYVDSTQVVTVDRAWATNPDNTSVYTITYDDAPALSSGLKVTGVLLVDTLTTYTGNTVQTGDAYNVVNDGTFGNAKLVRSTTPANTLTVDSGHAVAFNNTTIGVSGDFSATMKTSLGTAILANVVDLATSGHTTAGTFGQAIVAAGGAGDPWITDLSAYTIGQAGYIVYTYLNATVSSRLATSEYTTPVGAAVVITDTTTLDAIADTGLKRDWTSVSGEASRSTLNALRKLRNKVDTTTNAGSLTVFGEDDSTQKYTQVIVTSGSAQLITSAG